MIIKIKYENCVHIYIVKLIVAPKQYHVPSGFLSHVPVNHIVHRDETYLWERG